MVEKLSRKKDYRLVRRFVNYGQKSLITLGPGANVIKLFLSVFYEFSY
jgi:hypothetical protein